MEVSLPLPFLSFTCLLNPILLLSAEVSDPYTYVRHFTLQQPDSKESFKKMVLEGTGGFGSVYSTVSSNDKKLVKSHPLLMKMCNPVTYSILLYRWR